MVEDDRRVKHGIDDRGYLEWHCCLEMLCNFLLKRKNGVNGDKHWHSIGMVSLSSIQALKGDLRSLWSGTSNSKMTSHITSSERIGNMAVAFIIIIIIIIIIISIITITITITIIFRAGKGRLPTWNLSITNWPLLLGAHSSAGRHRVLPLCSKPAPGEAQESSQWQWLFWVV